MDNAYSAIQELLRQMADLQTWLKRIPYDGSPEVKKRGEQKYLYYIPPLPIKVTVKENIRTISLSQGQGMRVIPESPVPEFKRLLVDYYENRSNFGWLFFDLSS